MRMQNTLKNEIHFNGKGLHSGKSGELTLRPAPENTGIVFIYKKGRERLFIPYKTKHVVDTKNNIAISNGQAVIHTVEHLVAALYGLHVDNCFVECDTNEIPIMDGSSGVFTEAIIETGVVSQSAEREELKIVNPVWITLEDKFIVALPYDGLKLSYTISFPNSPIGTQSFNIEIGKESFITQLSRARTFGFIEDLDYYRKNGLVLGGDMENVQVFSKLENRALNDARYDDEPVRHKVLDLLGALAILDLDIHGFIISFKGGHTIDIMFAERVINMLSGMQKVGNTYKYGRETSYYYSMADILDLDNFPS